MARKPVRKNEIDKSQNKRIAKLERQFPSVNEVVNLSLTSTLTGAIPNTIGALVPTALDTEKVEFRGFSLRTQWTNSLNPPAPNNLVYRVIVLQYKCTAVYGAGGTAATYTEPTINDILQSGSANFPLANYNPDNSSRMRILYDSQQVTDVNRFTNLFSKKKLYKKSITQHSLVDKAFVMRPFVVFLSNMAGTDTITVEANIHTYTRQMP